MKFRRKAAAVIFAVSIALSVASCTGDGGGSNCATGGIRVRSVQLASVRPAPGGARRGVIKRGEKDVIKRGDREATSCLTGQKFR